MPNANAENLKPEQELLFAVTPEEYELMETFLKAIRHDVGYATPAEQFIVEVVSCHQHRPLEPWRVDEAAERFKSDFDSAVKITKEFLVKYSRLLGAPA